MNKKLKTYTNGCLSTFLLSLISFNQPLQANVSNKSSSFQTYQEKYPYQYEFIKNVLKSNNINYNEDDENKDDSINNISYSYIYNYNSDEKTNTIESNKITSLVEPSYSTKFNKIINTNHIDNIINHKKNPLDSEKNIYNMDLFFQLALSTNWINNHYVKTKLLSGPEFITFFPQIFHM